MDTQACLVLLSEIEVLQLSQQYYGHVKHGQETYSHPLSLYPMLSAYTFNSFNWQVP